MRVNKNSAEALVVIAALAKYMSNRGWPFGKTTLQRFVYLLKELYRIDCGYDFTLQTYGPFSTELLYDLDLMDAKDCVRVKYDSARGDYNIEPTIQTDIILKSATVFVAKTRDVLEELLDEFGRLGAKALELRVTILFVQNEAIWEKRSINEDEIIGIVRNLKPHLEKEAIREAMEELTRKGYISTTPVTEFAQA
jgi:uncharacterized protein YwgA